MVLGLEAYKLHSKSVHTKSHTMNSIVWMISQSAFSDNEGKASPQTGNLACHDKRQQLPAQPPFLSFHIPET